MKKTVLGIFLLFFSLGVHPQAGVGVPNPEGSAVWELKSSDKGFLPPRLTTAERNAIVAPAEGLSIYNTTKECLEWYNGDYWYNVCGNFDPFIASLDCSGAITTGTLIPNVVASGASSSIPYTGGNGAAHSGQIVASTGVTGLTATLSPGNLAVGNGTLVFVISGTPNATGVTTGIASFAVSIGGKSCSLRVFLTCGAYVSATVFKVFMCHNLGADTSLDPNIPVQAIFGDYYQWGRNVVAVTSYGTLGAVSGWITTPAGAGAWSDSSKTANDPCPTGYRVPTSAQWTNVKNNNTISFTGSFANDNNYASAIHFGPDATTKTLTLPAGGYRGSGNGTEDQLGSAADYWSSSPGSTNNAIQLRLYTGTNNSPMQNTTMTIGSLMRCIAE